MKTTHKSQSALEYMMTYGWAILVIVIVAGVLYSLGIFSPASSLSSTVTGFSNLGSVTGECAANGILRISLGDSTGYPINITGVTAKSSTGQISTFEPNSTVDPNPIIQPTSTYIFSVPNICPAAGSRYSLAVTVNYTEPGQIFPGPYTSTGKISGVALSTTMPLYVADFNGPLTPYEPCGNIASTCTYITAPIGLSGTNLSYTMVAWINVAKVDLSNTGYSWDNAFFSFNSYAALSFSSPNVGGDLNVHVCYNDPHSNVLNVPANMSKWQFVAVAIKNTSGLLYSFYLNGRNVNTSANSTRDQVSNSVMIGGQWMDCDSNPFVGYVYNAQIYKGYLSPSQIESLYAMGIDGSPLTGQNLLGWWPLNGSAKDYSGNGNNGVSTDVAYTTNFPNPS